MNASLRILSAAVFSLAAAGAAHAAGEDAAYPMGTRAGMGSHGAASTAATYVSPYVWSNNEVGLTANNARTPMAASPATHDQMPMPSAEPRQRDTSRTSDRASIFLGA